MFHVLSIHNNVFPLINSWWFLTKSSPSNDLFSRRSFLNLPLPSLSSLSYLPRYRSPTPPPCLSAAAAAPPCLMVKHDPPPPPPRSPRSRRGDPCIRPRLLRSLAVAGPPSASPSSSCCSACSTCPRPATRGERRAVEAGEAAAAVTTSQSLSLRPITWHCPTSSVGSASLSSW